MDLVKLIYSSVNNCSQSSNKSDYGKEVTHDGHGHAHILFNYRHSLYHRRMESYARILNEHPVNSWICEASVWILGIIAFLNISLATYIVFIKWGLLPIITKIRQANNYQRFSTSPSSSVLTTKQVEDKVDWTGCKITCNPFPDTFKTSVACRSHNLIVMVGSKGKLIQSMLQETVDNETLPIRKNNQSRLLTMDVPSKVYKKTFSIHHGIIHV